MPIATSAPPSSGLLLLTFIGGVVVATLILVPLLIKATRRSAAQAAPKHARTHPRAGSPKSSTGSTAVTSLPAKHDDSASATEFPARAKTRAPAGEHAEQAADVTPEAPGERADVVRSTSTEHGETGADQQSGDVISPRHEAGSDYVIVAPVVTDEFRQHQAAKFSRIRARVDRAQAEVKGLDAPGESREPRAEGSRLSDAESPREQTDIAGSETAVADSSETATSETATSRPGSGRSVIGS